MDYTRPKHLVTFHLKKEKTITDYCKYNNIYYNDLGILAKKKFSVEIDSL